MNERIRDTAPLAEYLRYSAEDRVPLNALLWSAPGPARAAALFVPGLYGSFTGGGQDYTPLARALTERGCALMAINLRTANDFTDPRLADAVKDIGAAVAELKRRGFTDIALLGTSLGSVRALLYVSSVDEPMLRCLGLIAPICSPYEEAQWRMDETGRARLDAFLADCRTRVADGRGKDLIAYERWFPGLTVRMTARGFLDVFGTHADSDISLPRRGGAVRVPVAVFHGTRDTTSLPQNAHAIHDSFIAAPERSLTWVEGGTHTMEPGAVAQAYAAAVAPWLARVMALPCALSQQGGWN